MIDEIENRERIANIAKRCGINGNKPALIYDPRYFSVDFIREFRKDIRWIFNSGPYDPKILREFRADEDPYGYERKYE